MSSNAAIAVQFTLLCHLNNFKQSRDNTLAKWSIKLSIKWLKINIV